MFDRLMSYFKQTQAVFKRACQVLGVSGFTFRAMTGRRKPVKKNCRKFTLAHTNLKTKTVTIDIYTPRRRQPKKMSAILHLIAHELAHHQKPPFRQRYQGRWINRQHYPDFYQQVKKNIQKFKKDQLLKLYYQK